MNENFKGKTLVISGATRGIGKAILYRFAQNGVNIAFTYNKNAEEAEKIIADVESKYNIKDSHQITREENKSGREEKKPNYNKSKQSRKWQ